MHKYTNTKRRAGIKYTKHSGLSISLTGLTTDQAFNSLHQCTEDLFKVVEHTDKKKKKDKKISGE